MGETFMKEAATRSGISFFYSATGGMMMSVPLKIKVCGLKEPAN
jgi:hypothetical protein